MTLYDIQTEREDSLGIYHHHDGHPDQIIRVKVYAYEVLPLPEGAQVIYPDPDQGGMLIGKVIGDSGTAVVERDDLFWEASKIIDGRAIESYGPDLIARTTEDLLVEAMRAIARAKLGLDPG